MDDEAEDLELECQWLVECGNSLGVASDLFVGAARRLRAAPDRTARNAVRAELLEPLRRNLGATAIALQLLERKEGGVTP
jgi:hypothetical protein